MPMYVLRDSEGNYPVDANGEFIEVFMNLSERNRYSNKNENGFDIYEGDLSTRFPNAVGEVHFYPTIPGRDVFYAMNVKYPPFATRKFGDKFTTPSFKQSPWYK